MKRFLEMIEHVKSTGKIYYLDQERKLVDTSHFFKTVEQAECLVFYPKYKEPVDIVEKQGEEVYVKFDSPFSVFSFEVFNGNITEPAEHRKTQLAMKAAIQGVEAILNGKRSKDGLTTFVDDPDLNAAKDMLGEIQTDINAWIHCILAWELEPNRFAYYAYLTLVSPDGHERKLVISTGTLSRLAKDFVERINREALGSEKTRQRIKIGSGASKRTHTIRRIVHVSPKRKVEEIKAGSGGRIEFSHRFIRRGTWVTLPGRIGKNRAGDYCVQDWTWRVESVVGPEDKPVIRKTRVIHEKEGSEQRGPK